MQSVVVNLSVLASMINQLLTADGVIPTYGRHIRELSPMHRLPVHGEKDNSTNVEAQESAARGPSNTKQASYSGKENAPANSSERPLPIPATRERPWL